jgi:IS6 family transposase
MPGRPVNLFKGRHYSGEIILLAVRWYLRYPLAYQHVAEMLAERGLAVDASCIWRWVQAYAPELNKRCRPHLRPTNKSYRIDETYIRIRGEDRYLYRALDSTGQTIDFLLMARRDTAAAKRFLVRAMEASGSAMPRVMNVDRNPAYPAAVEALKADGSLPRRVQLRQCKYLSNLIEQDHRNVKKRAWLAKGYGSFQRAWRTLQGIETIHMIRKGSVRWLAAHDAGGRSPVHSCAVRPLRLLTVHTSNHPRRNTARLLNFAMEPWRTSSMMSWRPANRIRRSAHRC